MKPLDSTLVRLKGVKRTSTGWTAQCPAHDDRAPSLSVREGDDGRVLLKCHAGCSAEQVVQSMGMHMSDLFVPSKQSIDRQRRPPSRAAFPSEEAALAHLARKFGPPTSRWAYLDAHGKPVGVVARWDRTDGSKTFRPVSLFCDGWRTCAIPDPRPLYRLPDLARAATVLVTEGEKAADVAQRLGLTATTSVGGAQAAGHTDWQPLAGKEVWLFPDNDAAGERYVADVLERLASLLPQPRVRVVRLPGLAEKGDIADWVAARPASDARSMHTELKALADAAPVCQLGLPAATPDRFVPFPVDALPEPMARFVGTVATAIGCDPSYVALPLLVAAGAAIGNARRLTVKRGWDVPPILWGAIVGESGTAKSPAFRVALRPLRDRQQKLLEQHQRAMERYEVELAKWEKAHARWKRGKNAEEPPPTKPVRPEAGRYVVDDTTVEALSPILRANPRGVLLARDELSGWFGSFDRYVGKGAAAADASKWLQMYNGEPVTADRKTDAAATIHVPRAAVGVVGGIPPGILRRVLGAEHRESGLASRLLLAYPERRSKVWTEQDIPPEAEEGIARLFDRLLELEPDVGGETSGPLRLAMIP